VAVTDVSKWPRQKDYYNRVLPSFPRFSTKEEDAFFAFYPVCQVLANRRVAGGICCFLMGVRSSAH